MLPRFAHSIKAMPVLLGAPSVLDGDACSKSSEGSNAGLTQLKCGWIRKSHRDHQLEQTGVRLLQTEELRKIGKDVINKIALHQLRRNRAGRYELSSPQSIPQIGEARPTVIRQPADNVPDLLTRDQTDGDNELCNSRHAKGA